MDACARPRPTDGADTARRQRASVLFPFSGGALASAGAAVSAGFAPLGERARGPVRWAGASAGFDLPGSRPAAGGRFGTSRAAAQRPAAAGSVWRCCHDLRARGPHVVLLLGNRSAARAEVVPLSGQGVVAGCAELGPARRLRFRQLAAGVPVRARGRLHGRRARSGYLLTGAPAVAGRLRRHLAAERPPGSFRDRMGDTRPLAARPRRAPHVNGCSLSRWAMAGGLRSSPLPASSRWESWRSATATY